MDQKHMLQFCLAAITIALSSACSSDKLVYQVTVRDFLPIWCMPREAFNALDISEIYNSSAGFHTTRVLNNDTYNVYQGPGVCPYAAHIASGEISGHPDFLRPISVFGWDLQFLYDLEDGYGLNTFMNGTCDLNEVGERYNRPSNFTGAANAMEGRARCWNYQVYSPRMNHTQMDVAPSGLPKPQYCTSDPNGRCGVFVDKVGNTHYQAANKYFQDMWFADNKKYNKRIGSTVELTETPNCTGVFGFDSQTQQANDRTSLQNFYAPHGQPELTFPEIDHPDPFEAKAWPQFVGINNFRVKDERKFLHTTEIHAFFEYQGNEVFEFSGDDDVWVYVNGVLVIEMGGVHPKVEQLVNLGHPAAKDYLNITVGEIYTFDLFQAERMPSGSNFKVTTTLASACNVITSKKTFFPDADGNSLVKSRGVDFNFADGSVYNGENIGLLPPGSTELSTFLFVKEEINVGTGFIVDFKFTANGSPEGFTFVLHQRPEGLTNFPVSGGANLGFRGITNSVAVAFDLCGNRNEGSPCSQQNVTIYYPEEGTNENKPSAATKRVYDPVIRSLKLGEEHKVRIAYYFRPPALEVTIDDSLYLREMPFDPVPTLGSIAAFAGFTASAGATAGDITIYDWEMQSVDVESSVATTVDFNNTEIAQTPKIISGNGEQEAGYSIQTRDLCLADIEFGNRAQNTAGKFVEELDPETGLYANNRTSPLIVDAQVIDTQDGRYTYNLKVLDHGIFSLYFFYGDREKSCTFNVSEIGLVTVGPASDGCFYGSVLEGVTVFPQTVAPSASPTVLSLPPTRSSETAAYVGAIGGSTLGVLGLVAAAFVVVYRRKWQRERAFIEDGLAYKMEAMTSFNPNDKSQGVGRQLLASRTAIIRARANRDNLNRNAELGALETEQEELYEQIRLAKQKIMPEL